MYTEAFILIAVMAVQANVNLFLSNMFVAVQTLIEVCLYGFVMPKIQCHIEIN